MEGLRINFKGRALGQTAAVCLVFVLAYLLNFWAGMDLGIGMALAVLVSMGLAVLFALFGDRPPTSLIEALDDQALLQDAARMDALAEEQGELGRAVVGALRRQAGRTDFFERVIKSLRNPVLITDIEGRITLATQALADFLDKPMTQIVGFTLCQAFYNTKDQCFINEALSKKNSLELQEEITLYNGRKATIRAFAAPIMDPDGAILGSVTSLIDMHHIVERDREREEQSQNLITIGREVNDLAQRVASAAEELSASADEQARGAQKQKSQTNTVATAMEEMTATVLEVARNATATSEAADEARTSAGEGVVMVQKAVTAINSVSESASSLSKEVAQLDSQAGEIGRIIAVINDIADQTNLLALNAAIEAARAGEAGRGFAVVADEVRKLAEKTMIATKEVEEAIKTIQNRSRMAVESMDRTGARVQESTDLSNKAGEALRTITGAIEGMVQRVSQIATAAEEQSSAAEEINRSIEDIAQVAAEADEGAGQTAAATRDLAELSQELLTVAQGFMGNHADAAKLRSSEGRMRGVLPKLAQDYVIKAHGRKLYEAMQEEMGHPTFLPTQSYPDQVLHQMAEIAHEHLGVSPRQFFLGMGKHTIQAFNRSYPRYFRDENLKSFLLRMNDVHTTLTKSEPGIRPPKFTYEDKGDVLFMNYRSGRGLFDYFEGILLGAAEFKGERIDVRMTPLDKETVRAEVRFLG